MTAPRELPPWHTPAGYSPGLSLTRYNLSTRTRSSTPLAAADGHHGSTTGYAAGCGCEECRIANAEGQRRKRARMKLEAQHE